MRVRYAVYKDSGFATLLSALGSGCIAVGVLTLFAGGEMIGLGIVILLAGIGMTFLAKKIGDNATNAKLERVDETLRQALYISGGNHEVWWTEVAKRFPVAKISNDSCIVHKIFEASPDCRKTYELLRQTAPETLNQVGWTCPRCGTRNMVGVNCKCGTPFAF